MFDPSKFYVVTNPASLPGSGQVRPGDPDEDRALWNEILTGDYVTTHITEGENEGIAAQSVLKVLNRGGEPNSTGTILLLDSIAGTGETPEERVRNMVLHMAGLIHWLRMAFSQVRWLWGIITPSECWTDFLNDNVMPAGVEPVVANPNIYYRHGDGMPKGASLIAIPLQSTVDPPSELEIRCCLYLYYRTECGHKKHRALLRMTDIFGMTMAALVEAIGDANIETWEKEISGSNAEGGS